MVVCDFYTNSWNFKLERISLLPFRQICFKMDNWINFFSSELIEYRFLIQNKRGRIASPSNSNALTSHSSLWISFRNLQNCVFSKVNATQITCEILRNFLQDLSPNAYINTGRNIAKEREREKARSVLERILMRAAHTHKTHISHGFLRRHQRLDFISIYRRLLDLNKLQVDENGTYGWRNDPRRRYCNREKRTKRWRNTEITAGTWLSTSSTLCHCQSRTNASLDFADFNRT